MVVTVAMVGAGWYFIARALARELRATRLQHDFVSSVSHEFRTPLTSISHVADLLSKDRLQTDVHRRKAYGAIVDDAGRLRDLVEHLTPRRVLDTTATAAKVTATCRGGRSLLLDVIECRKAYRDFVPPGYGECQMGVTGDATAVHLASIEAP